MLSSSNLQNRHHSLPVFKHKDTPPFMPLVEFFSMLSTNQTQTVCQLFEFRPKLLDSAIHCINHYAVDKCPQLNIIIIIEFISSGVVLSTIQKSEAWSVEHYIDFISSGQCYAPFKNLKPDLFVLIFHEFCDRSLMESPKKSKLNVWVMMWNYSTWSAMCLPRFVYQTSPIKLLQIPQLHWTIIWGRCKEQIIRAHLNPEQSTQRIEICKDCSVTSTAKLITWRGYKEEYSRTSIIRTFQLSRLFLRSRFFHEC